MRKDDHYGCTRPLTIFQHATDVGANTLRGAWLECTENWRTNSNLSASNYAGFPKESKTAGVAAHMNSQQVESQQRKFLLHDRFA